MSKDRYKGISVLLLVLLCTAFQLDKEAEKFKDLPPEVALLVEQSVQEKVANFIKIRKKICQDRVLRSANEYVDSLLLVRAKLDKLDTIPKPPKLPKPTRPEVDSIRPASAIGPLWEELDSIE